MYLDSHPSDSFIIIFSSFFFFFVFFLYKNDGDLTEIP